MWKDEGDVSERGVLLIFTKLSVEGRFMVVWGKHRKAWLDTARKRERQMRPEKLFKENSERIDTL